MRNCVTGHACLFNRPLAQVASPIPPEAVMHDWWLTLVAATLGEIIWIDEPLSQYRQHGDNSIGHREPLLTRLFSRRHWQEKILGPAGYRQTYLQAECLLERFEPQLPADERERLSALRGISDSGYLGRRWRLIRSGVGPGNAWDYADMLIKG